VAIDPTIDDPALDRLLRHVVEVMAPLEVWLFGSRAEGRARPNSDYDLLVVLPDEASEAALDPIATWRIGREVRVPADIVPCRLADFLEEKDEIDTLPRAATLHGRKLFER
jgi:predicted nucleotidyltransferase